MEPLDVARAWLEAMNNYDLNRMGELCWEDVVADEVAEPQPVQGRNALVEAYRELFEGFPDCRGDITNIFAGQDQVLAEVRWKGTNKGDFRGVPATGKVVDIRIAYIFKVKDGKIKRITEYYDGAAVAKQMGLE
jgi:steroid delta-isomerase-like uncharacterized protein